MDCSIKLLPQVRPLTLVEREKAPSLKHRKVSVGAKYLLLDGKEVSVVVLPDRRTANVPVELSDGSTILLMDLLKLRKAPKEKKPKAPPKPRKKKAVEVTPDMIIDPNTNLIVPCPPTKSTSPS